MNGINGVRIKDSAKSKPKVNHWAVMEYRPLIESLARERPQDFFALPTDKGVALFGYVYDCVL